MVIFHHYCIMILDRKRKWRVALLVGKKKQAFCDIKHWEYKILTNLDLYLINCANELRFCESNRLIAIFCAAERVRILGDYPGKGFMLVTMRFKSPVKIGKAFKHTHTQTPTILGHWFIWRQWIKWAKIGIFWRIRPSSREIFTN